eukprot:g2412.t1
MSKEGDVSPFALSDLDVGTPDSKFDESNASFFKSDLRSYEESLKELERKIEKTNFSKSMSKESEASMVSLEKRIIQALSLTLDQRTEIFQQARKDYDKQLKLTRKDLDQALKRRIKLEEELEAWKEKYMEIKEKENLVKRDVADDKSIAFGKNKSVKGKQSELRQRKAKPAGAKAVGTVAESGRVDNTTESIAKYIILFFILSVSCGLNVYLLYFAK